MTTFFQIDAHLFNLIYQLIHRSPLLDAVGVFFASYGLAALVFIGVILVCIKAREVQEGTFLLAELFIVTTLPYLVTFFLRFVFNRPRPFSILSAVDPLVSIPGTLFSPSFPSGHATLAFAFAAAAFFFIGKRVGYACGIFALLIALSRVFVGVHFVSDIVAGAAIGICGAWMAKNIFGHPMKGEKV